MRTRLLLSLCAFATSIQAQDAPKDLLPGIRNKIKQALGRLPNYLCTQTIDRLQYEPVKFRREPSCDDIAKQKKDSPRKLRPFSADRLRLDVAVANGNREMYSWVGENSFKNGSLFALVHRGALQNGTFSAFLAMIFASNVASFSYMGGNTVDGRPLAEFGYRVPLEKSTYVFGNGDSQVKTAYSGTFLADPKTFDLVRLVVHTAQLPLDIGSCEATTTVDYGRARLKASEDAGFLLPAKIQLDIVNTNGSELENRTVFSACREFSSESTVSFDAAPSQPAAPASGEVPAARAIALRPGLPFTLAFTQPIDPAIAAAGDRIRAKLTSAIRDSSKILVPAGAVVTARLTRMQYLYGPPSSLTIAVKLETLDIAGTPRPFAASPISTSQTLTRSDLYLSRRRGLLAGLELASLDLENRSGVFKFAKVKPNYVVKSGLQSTWVTLAP
jgi:hypothetical protein